MPSIQDVDEPDEEEDAPKRRDRIRGAVIRMLDGLRGMFSSRGRREDAQALRDTTLAAVEGGVPVGLSVWWAYRAATATLDRGNLLGNALFDGVSLWVSDSMGPIIGPLLAKTGIPKWAIDNGKFLAGKYTGPLGVSLLDATAADISREGWYYLKPRFNAANTEFIADVGLSPQFIAFLSLLYLGWNYGLVKVLEKAVEKVLP